MKLRLEIDGRTGLCCLIGDPVEHSVSPAMHNSAYQALGLNYVYLAVKVRRNTLKTAVEGLKALNVRGINVTTPHKVSIIPILDEVDEEAQSIGAVNTVLNEEGLLKGYNTDAAGALKAIGEEKIEGKNVVILGAGGAARAIATAVSGRCSKLTILNRTKSKAKRLAKKISEKTGLKTGWGSLGDAARWMNDCQVLINATPVGMHPYTEASPIQAKWLKKGMTVFDAVYNPSETKLLRNARARGAEAISGLEMLVQQAAGSIKIWFNLEPNVELMRRAAVKALDQSRRLDQA
ncbi:MAG: shikimate dehydrogenase [Candidatus Bathyarchaeia archaeon]